LFRPIFGPYSLACLCRLSADDPTHSLPGLRKGRAAGPEQPVDITAGAVEQAKN
jgi:hypothetical protein